QVAGDVLAQPSFALLRRHAVADRVALDADPFDDDRPEVVATATECDARSDLAGEQRLDPPGVARIGVQHTADPLRRHRTVGGDLGEDVAGDRRALRVTEDDEFAVGTRAVPDGDRLAQALVPDPLGLVVGETPRPLARPGLG